VFAPSRHNHPPLSSITSLYGDHHRQAAATLAEAEHEAIDDGGDLFLFDYFLVDFFNFNLFFIHIFYFRIYYLFLLYLIFIFFPPF
jgi:hypothetical protein